MDESVKEEIVKRLRVSRDAESAEVLEFWRQHGRAWAGEEASYAEIQRLVSISRAAPGLATHETTAQVVEELKAIWRLGWTAPAQPYGWDEMNDMLPPSAYLAFLRGVEDAWNEVSDRL